MGVRNKHTRVLINILKDNIGNIFKMYPRLVHLAKNPDKYPFDVRYNYILQIVSAVLKACNVELDVQGLENIPEDDGLFVCANHQDKLDALVLWESFPRTLGVVIDGSASQRHFAREMFNMIPAIAMFKDDMRSMMKSIENLSKELANKINYLIFPEGKYEDDCKSLLPFSGGSFKAAVKANSIIQPVAIVNCNHVYDEGFKKPFKVQVHYLKPITPTEYKGMKTVELANMVQEKIQSIVSQFQI
ncbi:MAG: 1-acyl-sn-glycerol-3-phosphate acyltransferase [Treponema sp.]|nr:1-acyl-sn-glycerol-3-phosphate acyltransferase [Treponema sp.]